jgi:hypothetical protein
LASQPGTYALSLMPIQICLEQRPASPSCMRRHESCQALWRISLTHWLWILPTFSNALQRRSCTAGHRHKKPSGGRFPCKNAALAGANAVYRSPTPSVPVLPLAPATQHATAREKPATYVGEAISRKQPVSAPVIRRASIIEADAFASPSSHAVRPLPHLRELRVAHAC